MDTSGETSAAALLSAQLNDVPADEALRAGGQRFRCVDFRHLKKVHLRRSYDGDLHALSQPATLGLVDAFVSHSWHDDADAKWAVLREWARC